jgi:hypothetical protein
MLVFCQAGEGGAKVDRGESMYFRQCSFNTEMHTHVGHDMLVVHWWYTVVKIHVLSMTACHADLSPNACPVTVSLTWSPFLSMVAKLSHFVGSTSHQGPRGSMSGLAHVE